MTWPGEREGDTPSFMAGDTMLLSPFLGRESWSSE